MNVTVSKIKPYFSCGDFSLYLGDSLKLLKGIPNSCIDMVFADPPYFLSNGGISVHAGRAVSVNKGDWDESRGLESDFQFFDTWIAEVKRILKPGGTMWLSGTYHSIYICGYLLQRHNYKLLNDISWLKPNAAPNLSRRYFTASHETLLWAKPDKNARHTFNYDISRDGEWPNDKLKVPNKQMRSVWSIPTPGKSEKIHGKHPTQKPLALLDRIILTSTNEGDIILDPFAGSSTTGVSAIRHGRRYIGMDSSREYLNLSLLRLQAGHPGSSQA